METTRKTRVRLSDSGSEFYGRRTLSYMWVMMDTNGSFLFSDDNSSRLLHKRRREQTTWLFLASCCLQSSFVCSIDPNGGLSPCLGMWFYFTETKNSEADFRELITGCS